MDSVRQPRRKYFPKVDPVFLVKDYRFYQLINVFCHFRERLSLKIGAMVLYIYLQFTVYSFKFYLHSSSNIYYLLKYWDLLKKLSQE